MQIVKKDELPTVRLNGEVAAHIFEGSKYGDVSCSAFIVDIQPNVSPKRHLHPYEEIFVIVEGTVRMEAGGDLFDATPDEICIVPAGVPHMFTNLGSGRARLVNIHAASEVITEFIENDSPANTSNVSYECNHLSVDPDGSNRRTT